MFTYTDQIGHTITLPEVPKRIVSVVPSQTELLFDLGLREEVVGITKFCIHPNEWFRNKTRVGGTKTLNLEKIRALNPDLILANKEENTEDDIKTLQKEFPVWTSDILNLCDAYNMITELGIIVQRESKATEIVLQLQSDFASMPTLFSGKRLAYFIWKNPYMVAASATFIHHVLSHLGATNTAKHLNRYPIWEEQDIKDSDAEILLLSSEPYPFKAKDIAELQHILPKSKVLLVDGELFSWYGSRLLKLKDYLFKLKFNI